MPIGSSPVQSNSAQAFSTTTVSVTLPGSVTAGSCLIAIGDAYTVDLSGASAITSSNNSWVKVAPATANNGFLDCCVFVCASANAGSDTITLTGSGTGWLSLAVYEWSGLDTSSPVDQATTNSGFGATHDSGTTGTTTQADELVLIWTGHEGGTSTPVANGGYTLGEHQDDASGMPLATAYKVVSATGTQNGTFTWESNHYLAGILTLKGATGGGGLTGNVSDSGSGADTDSGVLASALAESGSGADANTSLRAATISESAAGADADSGVLASTQTDTASGVETIASQRAATIVESASGADTTTAAGAGSSVDSASGGDTLAGLLAATLTESGAAVDSASAQYGTAASVSDSASVGDTIAAQTQPSVAESGTGVDTATTFLVLTVADVATAVDVASAYDPSNNTGIYLGDLYRYDTSSAIGSVSGATLLPGANQGSATGSTSGATLFKPEQDNPIGSVSGATILPSETRL